MNLYIREINENDKKEKLPSTNINCDKTIYRKFLKNIENSHFLI